jgi:tRNA A37 threonylcarbamoyladenosine synthetase subunit TsaC/SUA5/YrdC
VIPDPLGQAVRWLGSGGLLAYPTETVWGLAADASSEAALERMRRWKRRAADEPVAVLVEDVDDAEAHGFALPAWPEATARWGCAARRTRSPGRWRAACAATAWAPSPPPA